MFDAVNKFQTWRHNDMSFTYELVFRRFFGIVPFTYKYNEDILDLRNWRENKFWRKTAVKFH